MKVNDIEIHFVGELKDGTVLFVHGAGNNVGVWEDLFTHLTIPSAGLDLPGHGKSEGEGEEEIEKYAQWVEAFVKEAGIKDVFLAGHSMGGAIVQAVASRNPEWLKGAILISTGPKLSVNPAIFEGLKNEPDKMIKKVSKWAISKNASEEVYRKTVEIFSSAKTEVLIKDFKACDSFNGEDYCKNISKPTLIVVGSDDLMTPPKLSEKLQQLIKGSSLKTVEGCGHMVQLEKPSELAGIIMDFLKGL